MKVDRRFWIKAIVVFFVVFFGVVAFLSIVGFGAAVIIGDFKDRNECRALREKFSQYEEIFVRNNYCLGSDRDGVVYNLKALE